MRLELWVSDIVFGSSGGSGGSGDTEDLHAPTLLIFMPILAGRPPPFHQETAQHRGLVPETNNPLSCTVDATFTDP